MSARVKRVDCAPPAPKGPVATGRRHHASLPPAAVHHRHALLGLTLVVVYGCVLGIDIFFLMLPLSTSLSGD